MELPAYYKRWAEAIQGSLESGEYSDPTHCVHGTYVGDWAGPDYMCGACEMGESHESYALDKAHGMWSKDRKRIGQALRDLLINPLDEDIPSAGEILPQNEYMTMLTTSLFMTGDLRRDLTTLKDALEAMVRP